ncbi:hypothetical protein FHX16_003988 [Rhizobium sp. BK661]|nr:hypothetical protein [Rhizobium sp. BK661]
MDVDFAYLPSLNLGWQAMALRLVQIACIVITAGILWIMREGVVSLMDWGGPGFVNGFLVGALFIVAMVALIMWLDPSSRPRGTSQQKRFDDRVH